jgi:hypothetical protein
MTLDVFASVLLDLSRLKDVLLVYQSYTRCSEEANAEIDSLSSHLTDHIDTGYWRRPINGSMHTVGDTCTKAVFLRTCACRTIGSQSKLFILIRYERGYS